jgi:hypothetical protein
MIDRTRNQKQRGDRTPELTTRLQALAERALEVRDSCASTLQRAAELHGAAAATRAQSRALRSEVLRATLPREVSCSAKARRLIEEYLRGHPDELVSGAKSVASELVNNAYRHGEGAIELKVEARARYIHIEVGDEGPEGAVRVKCSKGRHGLEIVDGLSLAWGAYAGSTHVWADLPIDPERPDQPAKGAARPLTRVVE